MKLHYYETFYLLRPDLSEEDRAAFTDKLQSIIVERGGETVKKDEWPLSRLAYRVKEYTQGYYVLLEYGAPADTVSELTRALRLDERAMRFVTVKKADEFDREAIARAAKTAPGPEEEARLTPEDTVPKSEGGAEPAAGV